MGARACACYCQVIPWSWLPLDVCMLGGEGLETTAPSKGPCVFTSALQAFFSLAHLSTSIFAYPDLHEHICFWHDSQRDLEGYGANCVCGRISQHYCNAAG